MYLFNIFNVQLIIVYQILSIKHVNHQYNQRLSITKANSINNYQTQFVSIDSQIINDPSIGHQYICCYEQNGLITLAKGLTALARKKF